MLHVSSVPTAIDMPPKGGNAKKESGRAKKAENEAKKQEAAAADKVSPHRCLLWTYNADADTG